MQTAAAKVFQKYDSNPLRMWLYNAMHLNEDMQFQTGDILIGEDGVIVALQTTDSNQPASGDQGFDCSDCLVLPGLVNAHFHSQSSLLRGLNREMPLEAWGSGVQGALQDLVFDYLDEKASTDEFKIACMKDYIDLVHQGVTFCADSGTGERRPELYAEAMNQVGLRGIIDGYEHFEDLGASAGTGSDLQQFAAHLPEEEDLAEEALTSARAVKARFDPIFMTHSLETEWRRDKVTTEWGRSSIEVFEERGLLSDKVVLFHAVHLTDNDIEIVRKRGASVVHCPVSNLPDIAPVPEFLEEGINVAIGTDWARTDMWEAMRLAYLFVRDLGKGKYVKAEAILDMATINGAKAYLMNDQIGKIAPGYKADLMFVEKDHLSLMPVIEHDGFSTRVHNLVMEGRSAMVRHVMVDGKWIMQDQRILTVSEPHVHARYREIVARLFEDRS